MKTVLASLLLFIGLSITCYSQTCGYSYDQEERALAIMQSMRDQDLTQLAHKSPLLPVQFHIIGTNSGLLTIDSSDVFNELTRVNVS